MTNSRVLNKCPPFTNFLKNPIHDIVIADSRVLILTSCTVFSRIEAAASINIFVQRYCFYVRAASIYGIFCNNLGFLIWYQLCNQYARCHCLEINLLYETSFYLLLFYLNCGLYLRAASIR